MAKRSKTTSSGLSVGKVVVIGILSIVLLLVIVAQFGGRKERESVQPVARRKGSARSESTSSSAPTAQATAAKRSESPWPTFNLAEVVTSNPFMLPTALLPSRQAAQALTPSATLGEAEETVPATESAEVREMRRRQAEFMAGLRAQGVDIILRSPRGSIARIGELSLRVGDIHEGLRVEEIGNNGVIFAPNSLVEGQPE